MGAITTPLSHFPLRLYHQLVSLASESTEPTGTCSVVSTVDCDLEYLTGLDDAVAYFANFHQWSGEHSTSVAINRQPVSCCSEECKEALVNRRRSFGCYHQHKSEFYKVEYRRTTAQIRRVLKEARLRSVASVTYSLHV